MNRTPPNLVYLTIYNPSLRSTGPANDDDEDAEEQAHILFYTSKERAVSRDRMLRQIGLAKALVSFAEMFNAESPLDTVHSQTRRMIMVSPEPNFWIHACVELAKTPRLVQDKARSKSKDKAKNKGKEKEKEKGADVREGLVYDYEDGSVQDGALREDIMRGYERFKLTHGTFTATLNNLGQEALALQLERFWTPWAWSWSWSLEGGCDFGQHLGVALHPNFKALLPILDGLKDDIPTGELTPLLLAPLNIAPSTAFLEKDYPISLPLYLMSLIPPPRDPSVHEDDLLGSSQATIKGTEGLKDNQDSVGTQDGSSKSGGFLNMQAMDVRKWNWGGVLTFGRNSSKNSSAGSTAVSSRSSPRASMEQPRESKDSVEPEENKDGKDTSTESLDQDDTDKRSVAETQVDQNALDDAISSDVSPPMSLKGDEGSSTIRDGSSGTTVGHVLPPYAGQQDSRVAEETPQTSLNEQGDAEQKEGEDEEDEEKKTIREPDVVTPRPPPVFLKKTIHLQESSDALMTTQKRIYFLLKGQWMLALIGDRMEDENDIQQHLDCVASKSEKFFEDVEDVLQEEMLKSTSDSLPSATRILQPLDVHIASTGKYTFGSRDFQSKSGLLYEAKALQDRDPEISEVFSRGQNPQHWHMARRTHITPDNGSAGATGEPAEVYMEVFRKEASLADVDNVMAGVVKSWKGIIEDVDGL